MRELTNFDLFCLANEIKFLEGTRLKRIYQTDEEEFRLAFQTPFGVANLIIAPPFSVHVAAKVKEVKTPSAFAMALRKHLAGKILQSIEQPNMDRVLLFKFPGVTLVVELFTKNLVLLDQNSIVITLLRPFKRGARTIARGAKYALPEMTKAQPLALPSTLPPKKVDESAEEYLVRNFNISSYYAAELGKVLEQIPETQWLSCLTELFAKLRSPTFAIFKDGSYGIVFTRSDTLKIFPTFSQLLEEIYSREVEEKERQKVEKVFKKAEEKLKRKLEKQTERYKMLQLEVESAHYAGEKIKEERALVEQLIVTFNNLKKYGIERVVSELKAINERAKVEKGKIILEI